MLCFKIGSPKRKGRKASKIFEGFSQPICSWWPKGFLPARRIWSKTAFSCRLVNSTCISWGQAQLHIIESCKHWMQHMELQSLTNTSSWKFKLVDSYSFIFHQNWKTFSSFAIMLAMSYGDLCVPLMSI